ncbi:LysR family transcriptional regulator [Clostridium sp. DL-VIII]|uniref:LysR family transcriptional regulator n=1 Tax=Clostridium sp. DL-VIII TaxID=641107 RepID=UPI00030AF58A|nr:LysR family transcriptional regulator [Clostridium sp. DL-VIII]
MEIKSLITLKTIVEEGSFQKASEKLGYSQAAITFHIRQLEEEIGIHFLIK